MLARQISPVNRAKRCADLRKRTSLTSGTALGGRCNVHANRVRWRKGRPPRRSDNQSRCPLSHSRRWGRRACPRSLDTSGAGSGVRVTRASSEQKGTSRGARLAHPVDHAATLVDRMVQRAPPRQLQALIDSATAGNALHLYIRN